VTICLLGCGSKVRNDAVVWVGASPIEKATVEHWMSVVAASASTAPGRPTPQTPVPPAYSACIASLQALASKSSAGQSQPTPAQWKSQCEQQYEKLKLKALYFLISSDWLSGEAAELGVKVTAKDVKQQLAFVRSQFPTEAAYLSSLGAPKVTVSDMELRVKFSLLATKLAQKFEVQTQTQQSTAAEQHQALHRLGQEFKQKWTARTSCSAGYLVALCKQYKAPETPSTLVPPQVPLTE
jgi:foldase protein PrsA